MTPSPTDSEVATMVQHAEGAAPNEACGVFLQAAPGHRILQPCENSHPAPTRAYLISPRDMVLVLDSGLPIVGIYHSHVDAPGTFSAEDEERALWKGEPLYPDATYLVLEVRDGRAVMLRTYCWNVLTRAFTALTTKKLLDAETLAS